MLGDKEGSESTTEKYYVAMDGVSIVRIDSMGRQRSITVKSLIENVEKVTAFTMAKSTVNTAETDFNTFLDLYQMLF